MEAAYRPEAWQDFYIVVAGATAALTGLVFVAASLHISHLTESRVLRTGVGVAVLILMLTFVVSVSELIPGLTRTSDGVMTACIGFIGIATWLSVTIPHLRTGTVIPRWAKKRIPIGAVAVIMVIAGGIGTATRSIGGMYLVATGVIVTMLLAVQNSWFFLTRVGLEESVEANASREEFHEGLEHLEEILGDKNPGQRKGRA